MTSLVEDRYEMSSMVDGLAGKSGSRTRCVLDFWGPIISTPNYGVWKPTNLRRI